MDSPPADDPSPPGDRDGTGAESTSGDGSGAESATGDGERPREAGQRQGRRSADGRASRGSDRSPDHEHPNDRGKRKDGHDAGDGETPAGASDGSGGDGSDRDTGSNKDDGSDGDDRGDGGDGSDGDDGGDGSRSILLDAIEDPAGATKQLPYVLRQLEADEQSVRLLASTACCRIAVASDDERIVEYVLRRMSDRLTDDEVSLELTTALDYLSSAFPEQVEPVLEALAEQNEGVPLPRVGNFTRSYYYSRELDRDGVGRTRIAGEGMPDNPHHVVADREREERERIARERRQRERDGASESDEEADPDATGADASEPDVDDDGSFTASPEATIRRTRDISDIAVRSRFDELHVRGEHHSGRYATTYETLVGEGSDQRAVALRLLNQPDEEVLPQFDRQLAERLGLWEDVGDHDNVVTVFDWGVDSQPWVATALIERLLAERDRPAPDDAFGNALGLADAISHLHGNDVVHGGLDARSVVYPGERFDDDGERGPLVNNVGLITVFRHYFDPASCLDPRYAAPEYYDERFGRIDHATDIYQLGTVYYRLFTGRPPFAGEFDAVRQAVLSHTPPAPSDLVEGLPPELDEILAKTMAKQKLRRYETVEQLRGELASLADDYV